jgi:hypothetical protein
MNIQFQLQPIAENVNTLEVYLQELELMILNCMGSQKFKWNSLTDLKKKSSISDSYEKVKLLLENTQEVRETIRQLNREHLRVQLAIKNLAEFGAEIESKARDIEVRMVNEEFISQASFYETNTKALNRAEMTESYSDKIVNLHPDMETSNSVQEITSFDVDNLLTIEPQGSSYFEYRVV